MRNSIECPRLDYLLSIRRRPRRTFKKIDICAENTRKHRDVFFQVSPQVLLWFKSQSSLARTIGLVFYSYFSGEHMLLCC